jgi:uncharacterized protein YidB (DUF937 family)
MDILLGASSGPLGKLLSGKNGPLIMALLPVLVGLLGTRNDKGQTGLESLVDSLTKNGLGDVVGSWVGGGPNKRITPAQVKKGLGAEPVAAVAKQAGLSVGDASKGMAALLPILVNHLTPKAEVPQASALDVALQGLSGLLPKS